MSRMAKHESVAKGLLGELVEAETGDLFEANASQEIGKTRMTEDQIKHMVDRFLSWRLPEDFNPDGGVSFKKTFNEHTAYPMEHMPSGTNLFDASQAKAMVRHMIEGLPTP